MAYFDPSLRTVIIKNGSLWNHYSHIQHHRRHWTINRQQRIIDTTPPHQLNNLEPLDIIRQMPTHYNTSIPIPEPPSIPQTIPINWNQYVASLLKWDKRILHENMAEKQSLWTELIQKHQHWDIISNGSYLAPNAAYAWAIHNGHKVIYIGQGHAPGNPALAFRSKLTAIMSWHCVIHHILQYYDITSTTTITPYMDNTKVMQYCNNIIQEQETMSSYMDNNDIYIMLKYYFTNIRQRGLVITTAKKYHNTEKANRPRMIYIFYSIKK